MSILTLNCGSSSVKYAVYDPISKAFSCRGLVDRVGQPGSVLKHKQNGTESQVARDCADHAQAVGLVLEVLTQGANPPLKDKSLIRAVGHRVVHGGEKFARSAKITEEMLSVVEQLSLLAPLHNPPNLAGIRAAQRLLPGIPHVAVFDTAFHQAMEPAAYLYPLPYRWYEGFGIRRYGFHGTSHLYVAHRAAVMMGKALSELRLVTLHIGNGASAAAVDRGASVDTSMGFTPLEGLVMGTRCGSVDPAIPLYVMQREKLSPETMDKQLNKESGLLGITGRFSDRRDIEKAAAQGDERCALAQEIEIRTLQKTIGAYAAVMGGLDALVFTAGVGENSASIRARTLAGLEFLGLELDRDRNDEAVGGQYEAFITREDSLVKAMVIPTNEELVIAEDTLAILEDRFDSVDFRYSFA
jgi:acetate kinase